MAKREDAKNAKKNHGDTEDTENGHGEERERYGARLRGVPGPLERFGAAEIGEDEANRQDAKNAKKNHGDTEDTENGHGEERERYGDWPKGLLVWTFAILSGSPKIFREGGEIFLPNSGLRGFRKKNRSSPLLSPFTHS